MHYTNTESYWKKFATAHNLTSSAYSAWSFGYNEKEADELAALVAKGKKTATTSAYELYNKGEELPQVGEYNIILNGHGEPCCITQTKVVEIIKFDLVSQEHAYHEGEGDRSLQYWREVHVDFFKREYAAAGKLFTEKIPCVCEVFEVVDIPK